MPLYKKENKLKSRILLWPILLGLMLGCSFDVNDTQIIDIEIHQDNEKNAPFQKTFRYMYLKETFILQHTALSTGSLTVNQCHCEISVKIGKCRKL